MSQQSTSTRQTPERMLISNFRLDEASAISEATSQAASYIGADVIQDPPGVFWTCEAVVGVDGPVQPVGVPMTDTSVSNDPPTIETSPDGCSPCVGTYVDDPASLEWSDPPTLLFDWGADPVGQKAGAIIPIRLRYKKNFTLTFGNSYQSKTEITNFSVSNIAVEKKSEYVVRTRISTLTCDCTSDGAGCSDFSYIDVGSSCDAGYEATEVNVPCGTVSSAGIMGSTEFKRVLEPNGIDCIACTRSAICSDFGYVQNLNECLSIWGGYSVTVPAGTESSDGWINYSDLACYNCY